MADVFLSYSRADEAHARQLEALLSGRVRIWRDAGQIRVGDTFTAEIAQAIASCAAVVWLASEASARSPWVQRELFWAAELGKPILPLHLPGLHADRIPDEVRFLLARVQHHTLEEADWASAADRIYQALPTAQTEPGASPAKANAQEPTPEVDSALVVSEPPPDLLPIGLDSPFHLGLAFDFSGSMTPAVSWSQASLKARLDPALQALRRLVSRYREQGATPEEEAARREVSVFAYGFGFADRIAGIGRNLLALGARWADFNEPIATTPARGNVRDLLALAGLNPSSATLEEVEGRWEEIVAKLRPHWPDLLGTTNLRAAVATLRDRFALEFARFVGTPRSALLLVSDGVSRDGSPGDLCRQIAARGTAVLTCYLTDRDVAQPQRLYAVPQPGWPEGAVTLFRCASVLDEGSLLLPLLRQAGWTVSEGDRLFVQGNHSEHLSELASLLITGLRG